MPTISTGKVLVTGATGFLAGWVIKTLLDHGYTVRGTVRSVDKGASVKRDFAEYGDKLEIVVVEDMCTVTHTLHLLSIVCLAANSEPISKLGTRLRRRCQRH